MIELKTEEATAELFQHECYCEISDYYRKIAEILDLKITPATYYDPGKIRVSEPVRDEIRRYYMTEEKYSDRDFRNIWSCIGPRVDVDSRLYLAKVSSGFVDNSDVKPVYSHEEEYLKPGVSDV